MSPWGRMLKQACSPVKKGLSIAWTDSSFSDLDVCFSCIPRHKHGSCIQTQTDRKSSSLMSFSCIWLLGEHRGRCLGLENGCVHEYISCEPKWCVNFSVCISSPSHLPPLALLLAHTCQTGSLSFIKAKPFSFFLTR